MALRLNGQTSGYVELEAPATAGSNTLVLPTGNGTSGQVLSTNGSGALSFVDRPRQVIGTAVASTSGTSIDFTGIPSWVKRVTVMFNGVSTNSSSNWLIRLGTSSGFATTGYLGASSYNGAANGGSNSTVGFILFIGGTGQTIHGSMIITLLDASTNRWVEQAVTGDSSQAYCFFSGGNVALSDTLDRIRITTVNGTSTFDAGSINILYEG